MISQREQPFDSLPSGVEIARYFFEHTDRQNNGYDGIPLYREGSDYCYLWVEAFIDLDFYKGWLLEVRTHVGVPVGEFGETRDYLALVVGPLGQFEVQWDNKPIAFADDTVDPWVRLDSGLRWLVSRLEMASDERMETWVNGR